MKLSSKYFFYFICIPIAIGTYLHICTSCFGQQHKIDSLLALLKTDKSDTNKLNDLNKLSKEYKNIGSNDSALFFANSALKLSNDLFTNATTSTAMGMKLRLSSQNGEANAYFTIGIIYYHEGNYSEALKNLFASL